MIHTLVIALTILLIGSCKSTSSSSTKVIIGQDDRVDLDDDFLKRAVGYLSFIDSFETFSNCSAFLIGPSQIMTASHCIDEEKLNIYNFMDHSGQELRVKSIEERSVKGDFISLNIEGKSEAYLQRGLFNEKDALTIVSYDPWKEKLVTNSNSDFFWTKAPGFLVHKLDTLASSSGSPILQNGRYVGVHTGTIYDRKEPKVKLDELNKEDRIFIEGYFNNSELSESDKKRAANLLDQLSFSMKLKGNLAVIFGDQDPDISSIRSSVSFESLTGGGNDDIQVIFKEVSGYWPHNVSANIGATPDTVKRVLTSAAYTAVEKGYSNTLAYQCALRNTSEKAKNYEDELPASNATMFKYINRPPFGSRKNRSNIMIGPLDPNKEPCIGGSYTAGMAKVNTYKSYNHGDVWIHHDFNMAINYGCVDRYPYFGQWAGTIGHEMLHVLGQRHNGTVDGDPSTYEGRFVKEFGRCIRYGYNYTRSAGLVADDLSYDSYPGMETPPIAINPNPVIGTIKNSKCWYYHKRDTDGGKKGETNFYTAKGQQIECSENGDWKNSCKDGDSKTSEVACSKTDPTTMTSSMCQYYHKEDTRGGKKGETTIYSAKGKKQSCDKNGNWQRKCKDRDSKTDEVGCS